MKPGRIAVLLVAAVALVTAGCGGSDGSSDSTAAPAASAAATDAAAAATEAAAAGASDAAAVAAGLQQMVTVAADASVKEAHVYQSSGTPSLDQAAVDAIKRYLFKAAMRDDKPTEAQAIVTIEWSILASGASYSKAK